MTGGGEACSFPTVGSGMAIIGMEINEGVWGKPLAIWRSLKQHKTSPGVLPLTRTSQWLATLLCSTTSRDARSRFRALAIAGTPFPARVGDFGASLLALESELKHRSFNLGYTGTGRITWHS